MKGEWDVERSMSTRADKEALAGVLLDNDQVERIRNRVFEDKACRVVGDAVVAMADRGEMIDPVSLLAELERCELLRPLAAAFVVGLIDSLTGEGCE